MQDTWVQSLGLILSIVDIIAYARKQHYFSNFLLSEIPSKTIWEGSDALYPYQQSWSEWSWRVKPICMGSFQATFWICNYVFFFLKEGVPQVGTTLKRDLN